MAKFYVENTQSGDFLAAIGMGAYSNARSFHIFGHNAAVAATYETLWGESTVYVYRDTASVMKISSSDIDDDDADTGAQTVLIEGLDANYAEISETVTMNGQTEVNTVNSYLRVHDIIVKTAGSTGSNEGIIYAGTGTVTTGKPAVVHAHVPVGDGESSQAVFTVPVAHTGYLYNHHTYSGIAKNADARLCIRPLNEVFQTKDILTLIDGYAPNEFIAPILVAAKSDIELQCRAAAGGGSMSGNALIVLISD